MTNAPQQPEIDFNENPLEMPAQFLAGVGPKIAQLLKKLNLNTVYDLITCLPKDVLDLSNVIPPDQFTENEQCTFRGQVADVDAKLLSRGRSLTAALIRCDSEYVRLTWFNQSWMVKQLVMDDWGIFSGKPKQKAGRWEISNPRIQWLNLSDEAKEQAAKANEIKGEILPQYNLTEGLKMDKLRSIIRTATELYAERVPELYPKSFLLENKLPNRSTAIRNLHLPKKIEDYEAARKRVIFDDLFEFQVGLALRKRFWKKAETAPKLPTNAKIDSRIRRLFNFDFTPGQDAAIKEICKDLDSSRPMHRLLQADVGAGKTVIAVYAMLLAVAEGHQAVLMAPTELLANQHWKTIDTILANSAVKRTFLTGRLTPAQRKQTLKDIKNNDVQIIIGTQAVIQKDVEYANPGMVIIDEQHKFGVMQRSQFSRGNTSPHVLVMTATPIPRSLCLTQYGDLDLTTITDMPPGRQKVVTSILKNETLLKRAFEFIREQLRNGRQMFVVCPRIEEKQDGGPASAETVYNWLKNNELNDFRIALVHGRIDREQQTIIMDKFRDGEIDILVATTVVEVGVDIPNANMMLIVSAERFGLSQLHQLRGRIGRGQFQGYCFLRTQSSKEDAFKRLQILENMSDGFDVSEADFEIRGPGDILGTRQHGELPLLHADLKRDKKILEQARKIAFELVHSLQIDTPEFGMFKVHILNRFGKLMSLPRSG